VLLLDKPLGFSSNQALQKAKWLLAAEKAGHTGTLDPLATGVLPLCFGAATKFSQMHLDADKVYEAQLRLGVKTTTADAEGEILQTRPVVVSPELLAQVLHRFTGTIEQLPPMYSALKKDGKALYEYARAGIEVARAARQVTIHAITLLSDDSANPAPSLRLQVTCSKGTYIRTLAEDIGEELGCGAHLTALRRLQTGDFQVGHCVSLDALESMGMQERLTSLQAVDSLLTSHTPITLDADNAGRFLSGLRRRGHWEDAAQVAVYGMDPPALLGTGHIKAGELIPTRLLSPLDISQMRAQAEWAH
jgi:tRNA pseudouridine55 synthase